MNVVKRSSGKGFLLRSRMTIILGLVAVYASTSFGAPIDNLAAAIAAKSKETPGEKKNGVGGGSPPSNGKSCLSGAQQTNLVTDGIAGIPMGQAQMKFTDRGPVVTICGKTEIATDPSAYADPKSLPQGQKPEKRVGWCVKNEDLAKQMNDGKPDPENAKKFSCGELEDSSKSAQGAGQRTQQGYKFKIPCEGGGEANGQVFVTKDEKGAVISSILKISGDPSDTKNPFHIVMRQDYQKVGEGGQEENVKGKLTITKVSKDGNEAGNFHIPIEGTINNEGPKPGEPDEGSGAKFKTCSVEGDGQGPVNSNEATAPVNIDLSRCSFYRGRTIPMMSENYAGCRSTQEKISMMEQYKPKETGQK